MMPTATPSGRFGLDDPAKFAVLRRVPILDTHPPIDKTVRDLKHATPDNPTGIVHERLTCDEADLDDLIRNSNRRADSGRPAVLQFGHTP